MTKNEKEQKEEKWEREHRTHFYCCCLYCCWLINFGILLTHKKKQRTWFTFQTSVPPTAHLYNPSTNKHSALPLSALVSLTFSLPLLDNSFPFCLLYWLETLIFAFSIMSVIIIFENGFSTFSGQATISICLYSTIRIQRDLYQIWPGCGVQEGPSEGGVPGNTWGTGVKPPSQPTQWWFS